MTYVLPTPYSPCMCNSVTKLHMHQCCINVHTERKRKHFLSFLHRLSGYWRELLFVLEGPLFFAASWLMLNFHSCHLTQPDLVPLWHWLDGKGSGKMRKWHFLFILEGLVLIPFFEPWLFIVYGCSCGQITWSTSLFKPKNVPQINTSTCTTLSLH